MEELTIEQKAKFYDEAIKRAKAMIEVAANQEETYNSVITIFPQLCESEDERIRKDLLGYLHTLPNHFSHNGSLVTEWIAWLEKRGETFTKRDIDDAWLKGISDCNRELDKQSEQKPTFDVEIPFGAKDSELIEATYFIPKGYYAEITGNEVRIKRGKIEF